MKAKHIVKSDKIPPEATECEIAIDSRAQWGDIRGEPARVVDCTECQQSASYRRARRRRGRNNRVNIIELEIGPDDGHRRVA